MASNYSIGDHLVVDRGTYSHHGLYSGHGRVIHYAGSSLWPSDQESSVQEVSLDAFAQGEAIIRHLHPDPLYSPSEALSRARSRIGETSYNLLFNNCEQFVNWCLEGKSYSEQAQNFRNKALMAGGTQAAMTLAGQALHQSVRQTSTTVAKGAAGKAASTGIMSSLATPLSLVVGVGLVGYGVYRLISK